MSVGIPLSYKGCNSTLLSKFEWSTDFFWINTLSGFEIIPAYKLACSYCGCWQKTWDSWVRDFITYGIANSMSIMLALAPYASQVSQRPHRRASIRSYKCICIWFVSQIRNTELGESTAFIVNENKLTLCLEGDVTSSFKGDHCKCSPKKWLG